MYKVGINNKYGLVGLLVFCIVFAILLSSHVHAWGGIKIKNPVEVIKENLENARDDIIDEIERIPGNLSNARNDVVDSAQKAREDVANEIARIPQNLEAQARNNVESYMAAELDELRRGFPVQPDIIQEKVKGAILNLVPGYSVARLAMIAKNVALAADKFRLVNAHGNNLVNRVQGWPQNNK